MAKLYRMVELPSDEEVDYVGYPSMNAKTKEEYKRKFFSTLELDPKLVGFVEVDTEVLSENVITNLDEAIDYFGSLGFLLGF